ncbi:histidine phosphatase family protein [Subtercola endophyticus]|uniref:histidine phosphatase family protein n=1 Tax=Subtercola endophyticus TaxID=2895559 RepID=UPI001E6215E6|nr:histidine phosphatase family protein [Subtercola endophyticus]UFS58712.1 phosphoglycerate mutase family protein [Subtercola endophyticus]
MTIARLTSQTTELILVRHAASTRAQVGIWGRLYDAPLAEGFESQMALTRSKADLQFLSRDRIISSPLRRCLETAAFIFPGTAPEVVPEFRAFHSGDFEAVSESFIQLNYPEYLDMTFRGRFLNPRHGEESIEAQVRRIARGLARVLADHDTTIVIVTHYSCLNIIANLGVRNWDINSHADGKYDVALGSYFRLTIDPVAVLSDIEDQLADVSDEYTEGLSL